ncbi:MAG: sensor domain-containing diguanylate cyclase [Anaerolineales bacterium]
MKFPGLFRKRVEYKEDTDYVYPSAFAAILIFLIIILDIIFGHQPPTSGRLITIGIGIGGSLYIILQSVLIFPRIQKYRSQYIWVNAVLSALGLSLLALVLNEAHDIFYSILLLLTITSTSVISGRGPTYLLIVISGFTYIFIHQIPLSGFLDWSIHILPVIASVVITETIVRLRQATQTHIKSLETLNVFSQQINSSLETNQVLSLLNAALQKGLAADSYFVGLVDEDMIRLDLFYDDGEYFSNIQIPLDNTPAGWVIKNQKTLFLPDMRDGTMEENIYGAVIGKNKRNLSWIGVPMKTVHVNGLLAVASYKANTFNQTDMELLSNMAQHAALALDNTVHHKQVEQQSRLDSLTGTYNHRYFLQALKEQIEEAQTTGQVISLIMLDIDFFKSYNDSFGHQVGDMVLTTLCATIQQNIKKNDFVGRWGGEEFAILLPGANGTEANQVAMRVQETMQNLVLDDPEHDQIPTPTVSQGISVFPDEAKEIDRFIYLADQRLYKAKERGRNQIEPDPSHWETIHTAKKLPGA